MRGAFREILVIVALVAATLAVYWPVRHHNFIDFDDPHYVTDNPQVAEGLKPDDAMPVPIRATPSAAPGVSWRRAAPDAPSRGAHRGCGA